MATKTSTISSRASEMDDWRAQDDMRCLLQAEEIENDPKRMAAVRKAARKALDEQMAKAVSMKELADGEND